MLAHVRTHYENAHAQPSRIDTGLESRCLRARGRPAKMYMRRREKVERASLYCVRSFVLGAGDGMRSFARLEHAQMPREEECCELAQARGRLDVFAALYFGIPERVRRCLPERYMLAGRKQVWVSGCLSDGVFQSSHGMCVRGEGGRYWLICDALICQGIEGSHGRTRSKKEGNAGPFCDAYFEVCFSRIYVGKRVQRRLIYDARLAVLE